jgi:peptidoglycan/xylan/chitin deacetylase (PgdA/CDA1 family)
MGRRNFLSPQQWIERALAGRLEARHRCITLDDALLCQIDVALPVFQAFGLTAFWFVYSAVFEGERERMELFRHFRTTRYPDIEDFYRAFFERLRLSEAGSEFAQRSLDFDPKRYLSNYSFYTDNDRRFRFARDVVLGQRRYFDIVDAMMREDSGYDIDAAAKLLWMTDDDIRALHADGHVIGLHSYSHPTALADLPVDEQERQYQENTRHLSSVLGARPETVSHPVNSYSAETLAILRRMEVKIGFRDNLNSPPDASLLEMPRDDHANILRQIVR